MQLALKGITSNAVPLEMHEEGMTPFGSWVPADVHCFGLELVLTIGPAQSNLGDDFRIFVCTKNFPAALNLNQQRELRGVKRLFVERYDWNRILGLLLKFLADCDSEGWTEALSCLRKRFDWEFENYSQPAAREIH